MPRGRRKAAEQAPAETISAEVPVSVPEQPKVYKFESEQPVFKPVEDTNLEGIACTARFSIARQIPDLKCHAKCSDQIYSITRNGCELYFKIPNLPTETIINLWAAARGNISVEDFLIELQTINGIRPIIFHTDLKSLL